MRNRMISTGLLALALVAALVFNAIAPARVAHAAYIPPARLSSAARVASHSRIAPDANSSATCVRVVGTGSQAWRGLAAHETLCSLR